MKITIAGYSYTGKIFARVLRDEGHAVTVIDLSKARALAAQKELSVDSVVGNVILTETVAAAGKTDLFIGATGKDEINLLSCLCAKRAGATYTMAISHAPELLGELRKLAAACDIDVIINPEFETASVIYRSISIPAAVNVSAFAGGRAELAHVEVCQGSEIIGKTLAQIRMSSKLSVLVCAVDRGGKVIIPDGRFVIEEGDDLYITGPHDELYAFIKMIGLPDSKIKKIMIIGGSNISLFLAQRLEKSGTAVKIIEKEESVCEQLRATLKKAHVICGDPFDGKLLSDEGIGNVDAVMALSEKNEDNVIVAMYAKESGAKKIVTRVSKDSLEKMLPDMGYNSSIVSREKTLTRIAMTYARTLSDRAGSSVGTVLKIARNGAEVAELIANADFTKIGVPLMKLETRKGVLIAGIIRGKDILYPNGASAIFEGDRVIVVSSGAPLHNLNDMIR